MFDRFKAWFQTGPKPPQHDETVMSVAGLLLAAGRGTRFDQSGRTNKLLAKYQGRSVLSHSAEILSSAVEKRIAVVRPGATELRTPLEKAGYIVVECPDAASGMGHSIAWGVAEAMKAFDMQLLMVALADMPKVKKSTLQRLIIAAKQSERIVAPCYRGKRGNPVVFHRKHFEALSRLSGDRGATQFMKDEQVELIEVDDPGIHKDIDSPEDLTQ
jgi:molybdenum cofactor cytidylyltransferase